MAQGEHQAHSPVFSTLGSCGRMEHWPLQLPPRASHPTVTRDARRGEDRPSRTGPGTTPSTSAEPSSSASHFTHAPHVTASHTSPRAAPQVRGRCGASLADLPGQPQQIIGDPHTIQPLARLYLTDDHRPPVHINPHELPAVIPTHQGPPLRVDFAQPEHRPGPPGAAGPAPSSHQMKGRHPAPLAAVTTGRRGRTYVTPVTYVWGPIRRRLCDGRSDLAFAVDGRPFGVRFPDMFGEVRPRQPASPGGELVESGAGALLGAGRPMDILGGSRRGAASGAGGDYVVRHRRYRRAGPCGRGRAGRAPSRPRGAPGGPALARRSRRSGLSGVEMGALTIMDVHSDGTAAVEPGRAAVIRRRNACREISEGAVEPAACSGRGVAPTGGNCHVR